MADVIYNTIGSLGVVVILSTYFLLQMNRIKADSLNYSLLNFFGSGMILISLFHDFNFPSFLVELAWSIISIMGIVRWFAQAQRVKFHE